MHRSLRIWVVLLTLLILALQAPVLGDVLSPNGGYGRTPNGQGGGGITILPSVPQAEFSYAAGEDVRIELPASMRNAVIVMEVDAIWASAAMIRDGQLRLDGDELQQVFRAGLREFRVLTVNTTQQWLLFVVRFDDAGDVRVAVY